LRGGAATLPQTPHTTMENWIWVKPNMKIRRLPNGEWHGIRTEYVADTMQKSREMRAGALKRAKDARTTTDSGTLVAVMPRLLSQEMVEKCGNDPDLHKMFLRDHKECLVCGRGDAHLPPKRLIFLPPGMRS